MSIESRIEYVKTDDGVSLACTKFGSGPALIVHFGSTAASDFGMEFAVPGFAQTYELLASIATVIRYDPRNTGLSTRGVEDVSVDACLRDLDAVRRHYQLESAALLFPLEWVRIAVEYASAQPERVMAIVSPHPQLYPETGPERTRFNELGKAAARLGPEVYSSIRSVLAVGLEAHENAAWLAKYTLHGADFDDMMRGNAAMSAHDASAAAANVRCPTLFLHRRLPRYAFGPATEPMLREHRASIARLSASIPGAESTMLDGSSIWYFGDDEMTARMMAFLRRVFADKAVAAETADTAIQSGTRTVLFTDIVGHTEMMSRLGDAKGRDVLREHERITRETLVAHGGAEVKTMGDGFMASFGSVTSAVECAIALQRAFASQNQEPGTENLNVRVGLNAGEPIEEDGDLFGATVILASRIAAKAGAGEILVPDTVRGLLSGKGFMFSDRGEFVPKGFDEGVRLYEVRWREES